MTPDAIASVVDTLAAAATTREVSLDAIGEAIGTRAASTDDVDAILAALEARGLSVTGPRGGGGEGRLKEALGAARVLLVELGRRPTMQEIATRTGLSLDDVRHAFALAKVMQR